MGHEPPSQLLQPGQTRPAIREKIERTTERAERYPLLENVWRLLVEKLAPRLRAVYGVPVEVRSDRRDILRLANFLESLPDARVFCAFEAKEWAASGLLIMDQAIAEANLDLLLGANGGSASEPEERLTTAVDRILTRRLSDAVLAELAAAFSAARSEIGELTMTCTHVASASQAAAIAPPQIMAFIGRMAIEIGPHGCTGHLDIVLPMPMLDPIRRYLTDAYRGDHTKNDFAWSRHICGALLELPLPIEVELERLHLPLHQVMNWNRGDLLPLSTDASADLTLHIDDVDGHELVITGKLGSIRGHKAIKITNGNAMQLAAPLAQLARQLGAGKTVAGGRLRLESAPEAADSGNGGPD